MSAWHWTPDETGLDEDDSPMCPWCGDLIPPMTGHRCGWGDTLCAVCWQHANEEPLTRDLDPDVPREDAP